MSAPGKIFACKTKAVPPHQAMEAARVAVDHNPANAPNVRGVAELVAESVPLGAARLALLTSKFWGPKGVNLTVSFMGTPRDKGKLLGHMGAWGSRANVKFTEKTSGGQVRIAFQRNEGFYSYLGTDVLMIPANEQTMNLEGFDGDMPDSEYFRVVRHETGHTLGFPHEHMRRELVARIDRAKAIAYFRAWDGWDEATTVAQVLTPLDDRALTFISGADQRSIMCYDIDQSITTDGQPILGGSDIDENDYLLAEKIYPKAVTPPPPGAGATLTLREDAPAGNTTMIFGNWPSLRIVHGTLDQPVKAGKHEFK